MPVLRLDNKWLVIGWHGHHDTLVRLNTHTRRSRRWRRAWRAARHGDMKKAAWHLFERRIGSSHD